MNRDCASFLLGHILCTLNDPDHFKKRWLALNPHFLKSPFLR